MTLSHGARNRKLTKDTLRIAPGKLNLPQDKHFGLVENSLDDITKNQIKSTRQN